MGNIRKHRDITLVTTNKRRNWLASEPIYHTTKYFSENLMELRIYYRKNRQKTDFSRKKGPLEFLNKIKNDGLTMEEAKESQEYFNKYFKKIQIGNKTEKQNKTLANLNIFLTEELMLSNLLKIIVQWFLRLKKGRRGNRTESSTT